MPVEDMRELGGAPVVEGEPRGSRSGRPSTRPCWSWCGATLHDRVRQQPPLRGAGREPAERAGRGRDRPRAPRLDRPRAAARGRGPAEARRPARPGGHLLAGAWHRHGRGRPGGADRVAQVGGCGPAAGGPCRALGRPGLARALLPEVARRPAGDGGGDAAHARGRDRAHARAPPAAGRAGPAGGGDGGDGRVAGRRPARAGAPRLPLQRALARRSSRACWRCWPGRYPSDEFAELRPRIVWDRTGAASAAATAPGGWR